MSLIDMNNNNATMTGSKCPIHKPESDTSPCLSNSKSPTFYNEWQTNVKP